MNINQIFNLDQLDELLNAKIEFGQLFLFTFKDMYVVLRPLTIGETEALNSLSEKLNSTAVEDWIFFRTYVTSNRSLEYFLNLSLCKVVSEVANKLASMSNIQEEADYKKTIMLSRESINTVQNVIEKIIQKGYPSYDYLKVKGLSQNKQFELLAKAEIITGEQLDLGNKVNTRKALRNVARETTVLGGTESITSPLVADKPDFNEEF